MIELVLEVVWRRPSTVYECRHCGTTVTAHASRCPRCGYDEIAVFECE
jgi:rubrerythrin